MIPKAPIAALQPKRMPAEPDPAEGPVRRLHLNECPYPPSPKAIAAMQAAAGEVNLYPDPGWTALAQAMAAHLGLAPERLSFCNGSDELIYAAGAMSLEPGDEVVRPEPCFAGYHRPVEVFGAVARPVPVRQDGSLDIDGMLAAVTDRTRLVFATAPMNPTGGASTLEEIAMLARGVPDHALLVLDEAYCEFGRHAGGPDYLAAMEARTGPWFSLRTLSKAYGLAGLRVGYAIGGGDGSVVSALNKMRAIFNLGRIAQAGAVAALADTDYTAMILASNARERDRLARGLAAAGYPPLPSVTNFVMTNIRQPAKPAIEAFRRRGILIAGVLAPGYETWIRISIGRAEDTDAVLDALPEALGP